MGNIDNPIAQIKKGAERLPKDPGVEIATRLVVWIPEIAFSTVAATEEKSRFSRSFPFLTIAYTLRAVVSHVLSSWKSVSEASTS
jgi:hypothetical protein